MSRVRGPALTLAVAGVLTMVLVVGLIYAVQFVGTERRADPDPAASATPGETCEQMDPPCPPQEPAIVLQEADDRPLVGWRFEPPPPGSPAVSADEAVAIAWGESLGGKSVQPIYALAPAGGMLRADTTVWLVVFRGVCVPRSQPGGVPGAPKPSPHVCGTGTDWNVIVDATSGEVYFSFSDGSPSEA